MGCDIHGVIEVWERGAWSVRPWPKRPTRPDGSWDWSAAHWDDRDYRFFSSMFGVRGTGGTGYYGKRGLPGAMSSEARALAYETVPEGSDLGLRVFGDIHETWIGDHSFTWVTLEELRSVVCESEGRRKLWVSILEGLGPDPSKIRVIVGFDN